jgi:6-pyruvoyltetrahydropterin/6-carboxytetrahydropterin synthase
VIELRKLAEIVNRNGIDPLDHKNLNEDIAHFANINPSVENIAVAVFDWLKTDIESAGCQLAEVKVFETPKTWASYRG